MVNNDYACARIFICTLAVLRMVSVLEHSLSMQGFNSQRRLRANIFIFMHVKFNVSMCGSIAKESWIAKAPSQAPRLEESGLQRYQIVSNWISDREEDAGRLGGQR